MYEYIIIIICGRGGDNERNHKTKFRYDQRYFKVTLSDVVH